MRQFIFLWILSGGIMLSAAAPDYAKKENWVYLPAIGSEKNTDYDVFYIYPTLVSDKENALMDWSKPEVAAKTEKFVKAQMSIFGPRARFFAPYVRQLEFRRSRSYLDRQTADFTQGPMRVGLDDTESALRYYLKHDRGNRPYILFGHSQGAMDLYHALKNIHEISPKNGFVAAYLPGLPRTGTATILADFAKRDIRPAQNASDIGVIIVWNTQNASAQSCMFASPGGYVINPLNWRTDAMDAPSSLHLGATFYDYKENKFTHVPKFCGARIDPERGALLVSLPSDSDYDAHGYIGFGVFHMNDVWFFARNIAHNIELRVKTSGNSSGK